MKRIAAVVLATLAVLGATSSLAGAAGARTAPVRYAPGSAYVYSSSGERIGTLTGQNLTTEFHTVLDLVSQ